ncbi:serine/threonine-protein kinase [Streptomyces virginiae]|uniref:serine/threonine-protein kinase n=1 Tax=Streptomyces virginiae TaxID=1961 RepID=UPI0033B809C7
MSEEANSERVVSGRYRLLEQIGRGGMGVVWRARDEVLARDVAVKEVRAPAGLDTAELQRMYRRLEREAWAAARVSHRGAVTVYDVASEDGRPWIVMELVRGLSLADVLEAEGPMAPQRAAHIGEQVLAALRSAHDSGVLHRDVKPANVLIANDGRVVLSDFGIASLEGSSAVTMTGEVVGSPEFVAPERALGREPGPGSDLWSLGVMLYACVEGVTPFRRATPLDTLRAVADEEPPPARRAGPLEPVLEGLLRKDPAERLDAADAARILRVVGAGGAVRASAGPVSGPDAPMPSARQGHEPRGGAGPYGPQAPPTPVRGPVTAGGPVPSAGPGEGRGAAGPVLAVGIALLLALAALGWVLLKDLGDAGGRGGSGGAPTGPAATAPAATTAPASGAPTSASASPSAPASSGAGGHVSVYVDAVRTRYTGSCPPPVGSAPSFTATVEVESVPVALEYRWATRSGRTSGPGWQSVTYEAAGPKSRRLEHTELTHVPGTVFEDAVRLEVRGTAEVATEWVATSVTCEEATPTGGASSPGASPSPGRPEPPSSPGPPEPPGSPGPPTAGPAATPEDGGPDQAALVRTGR